MPASFNRITLIFCRGITALILVLPLLACSSGGGNDSGTSTEVWIEGIFKPAATFKSKCAVPRTDLSYADMLGTVLDENNWLRSWSDDVYLWYAEIPDLNPANYNDPEQYFSLLKTNLLTLTGNPKDRFHFTYPTDLWEQLSQSGVSPGYGATWTIINATPPREVVVAYTEPNSPATDPTVNLMRGTSVLAIDGVDMINSNDTATLNAGLFPENSGETHTFTVQDVGASTTRTVTMTSAAVTSQPVQQVPPVATSSGSVGYLLFNDHIATAEQQLVNAITQLKQDNVSDLILDLRYNSGGLLYIASQLAYMIAGPAFTDGKVFEAMVFNDKYPNTDPFTGQPLTGTLFFSQTTTGAALPTLNLSRVFVITGSATCSASESIINGLQGVGLQVIQIGSTTCGKPYGFYPVDNCGTTYFTINFEGQNDVGFGDYPDGFSPSNTTQSLGVLVEGCSVADDFSHALGDIAEARLAAVLNYRENGTCPTPVSASRTGKKWGIDAVDGFTPKPVWLENRIMQRTP